ncbi:hypothetical protein CBL_01672 [Carabus blaptoides fortunei]
MPYGFQHQWMRNCEKPAEVRKKNLISVAHTVMQHFSRTSWLSKCLFDCDGMVEVRSLCGKSVTSNDERIIFTREFSLLQYARRRPRPINTCYLSYQNSYSDRQPPPVIIPYGDRVRERLTRATKLRGCGDDKHDLFIVLCCSLELEFKNNDIAPGITHIDGYLRGDCAFDVQHPLVCILSLASGHGSRFLLRLGSGVSVVDDLVGWLIRLDYQKPAELCSLK